MDTPESKFPFDSPPGERTDSQSAETQNPAPEGAAPLLTPEMLATEPAAPVDPQGKYPEDLRTPWGWLDLLIFVFFGLGSLLVVGQVAAIAMMAGMGVKPSDLADSGTARAAHALLTQALWSGVIMLYLLAVARVRFNLPFWQALGWRRLQLPLMTRAQAHLVFLVGGAVLAILIQVSSALLKPDVPLPIEDMFKDRSSVLMLMAMGILVAPLVEETMFRGFLYPVLARSWGVRAGVIITGVLFGLMHASQLWGGWGQIGLLMVVGVVFTYVRARTGTVLAPYLLHLGYNSLLFAVFYAATEGLRNLPGS